MSQIEPVATSPPFAVYSQDPALALDARLDALEGGNLAVFDGKGDLLAATGANTGARVPVGTDGQVLTASAAAAGGVAWAAGGGGGGGGITRQVSSVAIDTTAGAAALKDYVYLVSGTTTLTLPTAVGNTNRYTVKNVGAATVTVATTSGQTIDGSVSASLPVQYTSLDLISDGANWSLI